jgi:hypothetical protein
MENEQCYGRKTSIYPWAQPTSDFDFADLDDGFGIRVVRNIAHYSLCVRPERLLKRIGRTE